jgi:hypothetical protein
MVFMCFETISICDFSLESGFGIVHLMRLFLADYIKNTNLRSKNWLPRELQNCNFEINDITNPVVIRNNIAKQSGVFPGKMQANQIVPATFSGTNY